MDELIGDDVALSDRMIVLFRTPEYRLHVWDRPTMEKKRIPLTRKSLFPHGGGTEDDWWKFGCRARVLVSGDTIWVGAKDQDLR